MQLVLFIRCCSSEKPILDTKIWGKKILPMKVDIKSFSEYICKKLKFHQRGIRSDIGILLKIILIALKYLACSTKILTLGNSTSFAHIRWHLLWICFVARCVHFFPLQLRKGTLFFLGNKCTHLAIHSSKKNELFIFYYNAMPR